MSDSSLSKSGLYYLIYNVLNIAFPFMTGIYVSHVLLPENIGEVAAAQNLAQYFVILAYLGIPTYGLREISKLRNNHVERSRMFSELYIINLISTVSFLCVYLVIIFSVQSYKNEIALYIVTGLSIALNAFNINWLFGGLEEFKFISIRNLIFKGVAFIFLIIFVKSENDVIFYALVTVVGTAGNYIVDMVCAPKFVTFTLKGLVFKRHLKPIFFLVVVNLAIELYSLIDITMMNFICNKDSIAFYKYGRSIEAILLQVVNTFTIVLVPRISYYYKEKRLSDFNLLLSKGLELILLCGLPMIIGLYFTADFLLVKLYGELYIASAAVLKLLSLLLLISPIGYLLGSRVMLVTGLEKLMMIPVGVGAIVNIIGNYLLIPNYSEIGAALASVFSELVVMVVYIIMSRKYFKLVGILNDLWKILLGGTVIGFYLFVIGRMDINEWISIGIKIAGSILLYGFLLLVMKEKVVTEYFINFTGRLKRNKVNE